MRQWMSVVVATLLFGGVFGGTGLVRAQDRVAETHGGHCDHSSDEASAEAESASEPSDESIFLLSSEWTNQAGRRVRLDHVAGHPTLVLMFYGSCTSICPVLIEDLKRIDAGLSAATRARVRFLLVTLDPARDTTDRLRALARERGLDERFSLLRGTATQVRELAAVLGVRYRTVSEGNISHSNLITLIDGRGEVVHRTEGLQVPSAAMVARIEELVRGSARRGSDPARR